MLTTFKSTVQKTERLIIFTRYPEPGKTKTRLIPTLGADGAADLQRQMTEYTLSQVKLAQQSNLASIMVCYTGESISLMRQWLGPDINYQSQVGGDLGERMQCAFQEAFKAGVNRAIIIGTDCPELKASVMRKAFDALEDNDLVLGPAEDGGYYLLGLKKSVPELFTAMPWGKEEILGQTLEIAKKLGLRTQLLEQLSDVDLPEDLRIWLGSKKPSKSVSIIIPTLNEEESIAQTLADILDNPQVEIIVADGGSSDSTVELTRSFGVKVIGCVPGGRANQMNTGALLATGEILLFLHADTLLPAAFEKQVQQVLTEAGVIAGAFHLRIEGSSFGLRLIERVANWRSRVLQMPYGDQAIFLGAELFHKLGGFPEIPIMEDFELVRRLRRYGTIAIAPLAVTTSGRRWQRMGIWRTTLVNQLLVLAYCLGVAPSNLAKLYRGNNRLLPVDQTSTTTLIQGGSYNG